MSYRRLFSPLSFQKISFGLIRHNKAPTTESSPVQIPRDRLSVDLQPKSLNGWNEVAIGPS